MSENIREKYVVLDLPANDYQSWINIITRVSAVIEDSKNFICKGEAQTTQYASRSGALQSEYLAASSSPHVHGNKDHDGDTTMGGMKIDLHSLVALVAQVNKNNRGDKNNWNKKSKPSAPWLSSEEVTELLEKKLCLMCKKTGHVARFCQKFGPPKRPEHINYVKYEYPKDFLGKE